LINNYVDDYTGVEKEDEAGEKEGLVGKF